MKAKSHEKPKKPLILVVEDIPKNMEMICSILRKEGYRLAMAGNGEQALAMTPEVNPDLILLDIIMPPGIDGFQVCEELKKNPAVQEIPVIFLTAKVETEDVVKGFDLGAVDYITKPYKGSELLSRVRTHLELKFAREELKELNATKDKFMSIIAHDLRNPLQCLLLYADGLYNDYSLIDEDTRKDYFYKFYNNSNLIAALLENLLEWSRSQQGLIRHQPEKIDLHVLAAQNIELLKENAVKKNITVSSLIQPGTIAYADINMIRTVLRNLLTNAVKFTNPGGKVDVSAVVPPGGNTVEITVSDTGIGIAPKDIERLFRIDVENKKTLGTAKEKGTGMGLILCKEFVEKNNGKIIVTSEPARGTQFTFTLPTGM